MVVHQVVLGEFCSCRPRVSVYLPNDAEVVVMFLVAVIPISEVWSMSYLHGGFISWGLRLV